jgi:flagellar biosynthesis/type III secretory pathway protein FliH
MVDIEKLKQKAVRNIITSEFEIEEGLKIAFQEGYKEGCSLYEKKLNKILNKLKEIK